MKETIYAILETTENATAEEVIQAGNQIGFEENEVIDMLNQANEDGVITMRFAESVLNVEPDDVGPEHLIVYPKDNQG